MLLWACGVDGLDFASTNNCGSVVGCAMLLIGWCYGCGMALCDV